MKVIGWIVTFIGLTALQAIAAGWALLKLWGWFIAPVFGIALNGYAEAIGFGMVVSFLTYRYTKTDNDKDLGLQILESFFTAMLYYVITVLFGWIVYQFV